MGGGAALFDMDDDGDLDLYLVQSGNLFAPRDKADGNRLYRNRGDGTFEDATAGSGADVAGYGMGVASGDFDNDGHVDLYVTNLGGNVLLKGDGRGHFADVTAKAGVASAGWSTSAAFLDYDADGDLDLFVAHYLNWQRAAEVECYSLTGVPDYCSPKTYDLPSQSTLYHNNGNGTFTDDTDRAGLRAAAGNGLGVVAGDVDGDGRIDVFVANDGTPNHLWMNRGGGRFENAALPMGVRGRSGRQGRRPGMGVSLGRRGRRRRSRSARRQPRRRIGLVLSQRENLLPRRRGGGGPADGRAGRSRASARRCSTSTTTACSTSTRRTAASGGSRRCFLPIRTRSRTCSSAASRDRGSRR